MATELLYLQDFNVETCDAKIVSVEPAEDGRVDVVLDRTSLYARGGGQDWDTGTIASDAGEIQVEEVRLDEEGTVHHFGRYANGAFAPGDEVHCACDHDRRQANTRLHSAAHVIDMAVADLEPDWVATKGQHYPNLSAIEYSGTWDENRAEEIRGAIEQLANAYVAHGSHNELRFMPVSEMHTVCRHVPDNIPTNKPGRVVMYGDFGVPCGGTHVQDIAEVGKITIPSLKMKQGVIRLGYEVEGIN